ncbi:MAG TPA: DUF488 domain-containing protein [Miltoncostaeaceae bacterium]|nr:DUF488 domain-containing protein [Miltoncostaeaceae bacterium]
MTPASLTLLSVGYERLPIVNELIDALVAAGVERVVDVRDLPQSRRPGFSRRALESSLADAGIVYEHRRELGNPRAIRALSRAGEAARGRQEYRAQLLGERAWALDALADAVAERPTAMLCLEADQARCHRDVIAEELARLHPAIRVEPLGAGG